VFSLAPPLGVDDKLPHFQSSFDFEYGQDFIWCVSSYGAFWTDCLFLISTIIAAAWLKWSVTYWHDLFLARREIQRVLKHPPTRSLSGEERQLLWRFRFYLMSEKRALTKFLRCVDWSDAQVNPQVFDEEDGLTKLFNVATS
jgi:hypothetical protein